MSIAARVTDSISGLKSSQTNVLGQTNLINFGESPEISTHDLGFEADRPSKILNIAAASSTLRVSGPTVSRVFDRGRTSSRGNRPKLVLKPTSPFQAEGTLTEPPVSEPIAAAANPVDKETAPPEVDPPGRRLVILSNGFEGVPKCGFIPRIEKA